MNGQLRRDALSAARAAVRAVCPDEAVARALKDFRPQGRVILVSIGKAGWQMAKAAMELCSVDDGVVITKYGHALHPLPGLICFEAGHPVPDENTYRATQAVLDLTAHLQPSDTVLFLLSGGGSALFEQPLIAPKELQDITSQLLASGAGIVEMNTVRKRLSSVKGGRFAIHCAPAKIYAVVLSDILGDRLDMIASGPVTEELSTSVDALAVVKKYGLKLSEKARALLDVDLPGTIDNVQTQVIGSVRELCCAAAAQCRALGYETILLTDRMDGQAREMGRLLGSILASNAGSGRKLAFLAGGETVVHLRGRGLGGRNQELALAAAEPMAGIPNVCLISVGSDGTDGPTDAAGGITDGSTLQALREQGLDYRKMLDDNDAYHALGAVGGLVITGPTGTNVNDVTIGLINGIQK